LSSFPRHLFIWEQPRLYLFASSLPLLAGERFPLAFIGIFSYKIRPSTCVFVFNTTILKIRKQMKNVFMMIVVDLELSKIYKCFTLPFELILFYVSSLQFKLNYTSWKFIVALVSNLIYIVIININLFYSSEEKRDFFMAVYF
jgi:hypothetical protein